MSERKKVVLLISFFAALFVAFAFFSEGDGYGGGDSIQHFLISKYSFQHPGLFLNHWGKPFFTLVSSPFSQFGFLGINIFNILCACFACWMAYDLAVKWQIKNAWLAPLIVLCTPIYIVCIISGLTEVFFATILMLSIWLFQREKYLLSTAAISFLPFVRTEGFLLLPLFVILLLKKKEFSALVLMATGTVLYSIIGGFYYHDFLWVLHQNPYKGTDGGIYGHGALTFFIGRNEYILGTSLVVLFLIGLLALITKKEKATPTELILCLGSFTVYFIAHSIFWWKGLFGSDGLIRVMAAVAPTAAFTCLHGYNFLLSFFRDNSRLQKRLSIIVVLLIIWMPFKQHKFPRQLDYDAISIKNAGNWLQHNYLDGQKIYCASPFMWLVLNKDPFDIGKASDFYSINKQQPEKDIQDSSIIIWDSHFSPNEGGVPLEKLSGNPNLQLLNRFETDSSLVPKDKDRFEIYIFQKK